MQLLKILNGSLEFFGFGEVLLKFGQKYYTKILQLKIQNNGYFSAPRIVYFEGCAPGWDAALAYIFW